MFVKILCATDFSESSKRALQVAARLATEHNGELVVAHVSPEIEHPIPADIIEEMRKLDEGVLAEVTGAAAALGVKRVTSKLVVGIPWDQIVDTLNGDRAYDLVVMGTQGRTGLARLLIGSVTEKVIRHAPCSVLAVRASAEDKPFRRVLCPIDFSDGSHRAMLRAGELAVKGGEITLLHVVEVPAWYTGVPLSDSLGEIDKLFSHTIEDWAENLRRHCDAAVTTRIEIGSPIAVSLAALEEAPGFDLAVVGSHGRTGIRRVLLGSVAEKVVRHAGCPVLVVRDR